LGAEVKLTDVSTSVARTTVTNEAGRYRFLNVLPGVHDITVRKEGFTQARVANQTIEVGLVLTIDFPLEVGSTVTSIEIHATAGAELQTVNAAIGSTGSGSSVILMPNLGRDASSLNILQVGVTPTGQVAGTAADQRTHQPPTGWSQQHRQANCRW
jgi:hypothetical protein